MKRRAVVLLVGTALAGCSGGSGRSAEREAALRDRAGAALAADGAWARAVREIDVGWWTDGYRVRVEYVLEYGSGEPVETARERADATAVLLLERLFGGEESINRVSIRALVAGGDGQSTERETPVHLVEVSGVTASSVAWGATDPADLEDVVDVYRFDRGRLG